MSNIFIENGWYTNLIWQDYNKHTSKPDFKSIVNEIGVSKQTSDLVWNCTTNKYLSEHHTYVMESDKLNKEQLCLLERSDSFHDFAFTQSFFNVWDSWDIHSNAVVVIDSKSKENISNNDFREIWEYIWGVYDLMNHDSSIHSNWLGVSNYEVSKMTHIADNLIPSRSSEMKLWQGEMLAWIIHKQIMEGVILDLWLEDKIKDKTESFLKLLNSLKIDEKQHLYFLRIYSEALFCIVDPESKFWKNILDTFWIINWETSRFWKIIHETELRKWIWFDSKKIRQMNIDFNTDISDWLKQGNDRIMPVHFAKYE